MKNIINLLTMHDLDLYNKTLIIREDFNVPYVDGKILDDSRLKRSIPSIKKAILANAKIVLLSHFGRPTPGKWQPEFSLQLIKSRLETLLSYPVIFKQDWINGFNINSKEIILCENVRFLEGELENDPILSKKMADLGDVFIMDAFACAHRAHASTCGIAQFAKAKVAGPLLIQEIRTLDAILQKTMPPIIAVIGGAKISSKLKLLNSLIKRVNIILIGGGMANTFLAAQGYDVGSSLYEPALLNNAQELLVSAARNNCTIVLPKFKDIVIEENKILDIGLSTISNYIKFINTAKTVLWNGPLGVFEKIAYENGTKQIALAIANNSNAFSIAGGGETIAAINKFAIQNKINYISTGGGAFLEYLEGNKLPGIAALC